MAMHACTCLRRRDQVQGIQVVLGIPHLRLRQPADKQRPLVRKCPLGPWLSSSGCRLKRRAWALSAISEGAHVLLLHARAQVAVPALEPR